MKRLLSAVCILLAVTVFLSCAGKKGPTEVDYGEVKYVLYDDGSRLSFEYLDCFRKTEMEEKNFITYTADGRGVLTYQIYDPGVKEDAPDKPKYSYAEICAFTDDQAESYMRLALGMTDVQGAEYTVDSFSFDRMDGDIRLYMEATAVYKASGEVQKLWMIKVITDEDAVYTLQAFAPASIVKKYGPAFRNVSFDV
ncbi:MAG: hypothetical protein J5854_00915 [Clostridia bacterium]|nr:hypothetical protein [Clostridia bacterium]